VTVRDSFLPTDVLPFEAALATIGGRGRIAETLHRHLAALGAHALRQDAAESARTPGPDAAATVRLTLADGRERTAEIAWAGPVRETGLADETTAQAVCGLMHVNGRRGGAPLGLGVDYCSDAAAVLAVIGLLAMADDERPRAIVRTSVAEAALLTVSQYLAAAGADEPEAAPPSPGGPPFVSADGVRFEIESLRAEPWGAFWTELGVSAAALRAGWRPFQFRYATAAAPMPDELHRTLGLRTFAEIKAIADRTGVSVCRLRTAAGHESELRARDTALWRFDLGEPSAPTDRRIGRATVLEAGRRIQAPLAAHLLRLLGARVVRIEPPGGDPLRGMPPCCGDLSARWLALNRGKEAVEIDIKHPGERARLRALAAEADVFLHNWSPGTAERLGLDAAALPGHLVYAYTSGWDGRDLPDLPPGTDFMVQARTGVADLVQPAEREPAPSLMTILDVFGGLLGAEAVLAGLLLRARTGRGVAVRSSLLSAATQVRAGAARPGRGFRVPHEESGTWSIRPDDPAAPPTPVAVTTDLAALLHDPRFADVLTRDAHGAPALRAPWRFA
jgi:CoA:oxalate CoA-transferase